MFRSFIFLLIFSSAALAQNPTQENQRPAGQMPAQGQGAPGGRPAAAPAIGDGKISGELVDSLSRVPVEFATIALYKATDIKKPIDGTITDEKGKFVLKNVINGNLALRISFIGYNDKWIYPSELTDKNSNINLGEIILALKANVLSEVTVTGQKALIEEKVDRMIYNAEKDITAKGGDASDILRKVPLLSVDLDGNVSLRGSSNIRVLINNKPSTIMASNIADALKQIPADEIKTVEVITSPSAKYDAEGTGGIINIITKKNNLQGLNLNINSGVGTRASNLGLNGSYRKGKFGTTLNGFGRAMYNRAESSFTQTLKRPSGNQTSTQDGTSRDLGGFGRYGLGFDYDIKKNEFLSGSVRYGTRNSIRNSDLAITEDFGDVVSSYNRNVKSKDLSGTVDFEVSYLKVFKPQQEFSVETEYSRTGLTNNFDTKNVFSLGESPLIQRNNNANTNNEFEIQADYMTPIKDRQLFETGLKLILRTVESSFDYFTSLDEQLYTLDLRRPGGFLDYKQNVGAGYVSYTVSTENKWTFKAGARYELTVIDATINKTTNADIPKYSNLVPSINLSKNFTNGVTFKTGYNRRIQRPGIQQLNPNLNISNPQSFSVGNPILKPELTDNIEIGLSGNLNKTYLNLSVYAKQSTNSISRVSIPIDSLEGAILTTFQNIGKEQSLGTNLFGNLQINKDFSINGGVELYNISMTGQVSGLDGLTKTASNSGWVVSGRLMGQYALKSGWQFQAFSFMRGRRVSLQGSQGGFGFYSLGLNKEINGKKGSFGISADNFLNRGFRINSIIESDLINQYSENLMLNRGVRATFSYRIGQMGFNAQPRKRTKRNNNSDIKEDGGNDNAPSQPGGGR